VHFTFCKGWGRVSPGIKLDFNEVGQGEGKGYTLNNQKSCPPEGMGKNILMVRKRANGGREPHATPVRSHLDQGKQGKILKIGGGQLDDNLR